MCSRKCYALSRHINYSGENAPRWQRGKFKDGRGYIFCHNGAGKRYLREHQIIASKIIGRPIKPSEVVHHINGKKSDNRPSNLQVMSRDKHARLHHSKY